jgi:hypothetical protein
MCGHKQLPLIIKKRYLTGFKVLSDVVPVVEIENFDFSEHEDGFRLRYSTA